MMHCQRYTLARQKLKQDLQKLNVQNFDSRTLLRGSGHAAKTKIQIARAIIRFLTATNRINEL